MSAPGSRLKLEHDPRPKDESLQTEIPIGAELRDDLKKSEEQLRTIINTIPTVVWSALPDGSIDFLSKRWEEYYDRVPQEGQAWGWKQFVHPEDLARVVERWQASLASGEPCETEFRVRVAGGKYRWTLARAVPLRDEHGEIIRWYGTDTDIEDLKCAEARLLQDEQELRRITDAIPQSIFVLNPDGSVLLLQQVLREPRRA